PRQRSLRAVFDYSWTLLAPDEQALLARLSVFRGGFTTRAAQAVTGATLPQLAALVDKSLLARHNDPPSARFEIPEVLRQYAAEKLAQRPDAAATHAAHADYYADRLEALAADIRGGDQPDALDRVAFEIENMRAAYRWTGAEIERAPAQALARIARSMAGLFDFYDIRGWYAEGRAVFAAAAETAAEAVAEAAADDAGTQTPLLAALRARQGWLTFLTGDVEEAAALLTAARTLAEAADDPHTLAFTLNYLGALRRHAGDLAAATDLLTRGLALAKASGDRYTVSLILNTLGQVASLQGDAAAATAYCRRALGIKRQLGDRRGMIYSLTYLGRVAEMDGRVDEARPLYAESLQIAEELDDPRGIALSQHNLANAALTQGQLAGARRLFSRTLDLYRAMGSRADMSVALSRLAEVALAQRDYGEAAEFVGDALTLAEAAGVQPARITALLAAGALLAQTGDMATTHAVMAAVATAPQLTVRQRLRLEQLRDRVGEAPVDPAASPQATVDLVFAALEQLRRTPPAPARALP
ncbi:MAG: tetratricopeptide repeat protein, partial [Caldilineaceae bacterium]|nr:tetratricopeptide repeat protein [Caldilineaceae bacterium]